MAERPGLTPSQTVGPFLHLALADPAARHAVGADEPGAITIGGTVVDGDRRRRCPTPSSRRGRSTAASPAARPDADGAWDVRTVKPPAVADARRHGAGAAPRRVGVRPRPARPRRHPPLLRRRGGRQRRRPDARRRRPRPPRTCSSPASSGPAGTVSTSACKVPMSPSSSRSDRPVRVPRRPRPRRRGDVGDGVAAGDARRRGRAGRRPGRRRRHPRRGRRGDRRGLPRRALRRRRACSTTPPSAATPSSRSCRGCASSSARAPPRYVHRDATSQDIVDAATVVVVRRCAELVGDALLTAPRPAPASARRYGDDADDQPDARASTPSPTTFGDRHGPVARRPGRGVGRRAPAPARLPVGLGGPSGDGTSYGEQRRRRSPTASPTACGAHGGAVRPAHPAQRRRRRSPARGGSPRPRWPRSPSTSCCSPRATSAS